MHGHHLGHVTVLAKLVFRTGKPIISVLSCAGLPFDSEVQSMFEKHLTGGEITGVPTLLELLDKKVVDTALQWLGINRTQHRD